MSKPATHKNPWGDPCSCPWFQPSHKEHTGATHEAAKLDWLQERPDVKADFRKRWIANHELPLYPDSADPVLPWIMREYNKGRLKLHPEVDSWAKSYEEAQRNLEEAKGDPEEERQAHELLHKVEEAAANHIHRGRGLHNGQYDYAQSWAPRFADMMTDLKKRGQGIDIMQHDFEGMRDKWADWEAERRQREEEELRRNNGQVVHRFDDPEHQGWTVRRLTNKDECDLEGELMGHCVGSYGHNVENGNTNIYSLRDERNRPHATMEIEPQGYNNPNAATDWMMPEHSWDELPMDQFQGVPIDEIRDYHDKYHDFLNGDRESQRHLPDHPAEYAYPEFMRRAVEHGTAMPRITGGKVVQTQGKSNATPLEEYTDMLNQFVEPHGLNSFKPWWDDWYEQEGPQNFREFVGHHGYEGDNQFGLRGYPRDDWYEYEPQEYRNAVADAEEHGVEEPELHVGAPDYHQILQDLFDPPVDTAYDYGRPRGREFTPPWQGYNPEAGQFVLDTVRNQDQWENANPDRRGNAPYWGRHLEDLTDALKYHMSDMTGFEPPQELMEIPDYHQRQQALREAEREFYGNQGDPLVDMVNHLGPELIPGYRPMGPYPVNHPDQMDLFRDTPPYLQQSFDNPPYSYINYNEQPYSQPWANHPDADIYNPRFPTDPTYSKVAHSIYKRWVFSPASGEVKLSDNSGHPFEVKYHTDLAREINEPNLTHGYAYRIGDGWRLTDWHHRPVEDPFVIASVMGALRSENSSNSGSWEPDYDEDWDRLHLGIPS